MQNWSKSEDARLGRFAGWALGTALVLGCTGSIGGNLSGENGNVGGNSGEAGAGANPGQGANPVGGDTQPGTGGIEMVSPDCTPADVLPSPLRRLSHSEFTTTLRDLFPGLDTGKPTLTKDPTTLGGFENSATLLNPSPILVENYSDAAGDVAIRAVSNPTVLKNILPCTPAAGSEDACGGQFIAAFGAKAFRRALTTEETASFTAFFTAERTQSSFNGAVQLSIEAFLQSPQLLYRFEIGQGPPVAGKVPLTQQEIATRLSYMLTGSMPDAELSVAATAGALQTPAQREAQARRLLADARAGNMMVDFHRQWLDLDALATQPKDPTTYPTYDANLQAAIREESDRFVKQVMFSGPGTLDAFLTSSQTEVNKPLATLYGVPGPATGWAPATLDAGQRAGFLTRANFLAERARKVAGSPPLRASFILKRFFCQEPPAPPANADLSEPAAKPSTTGPKTNRQLFEDRTNASGACKACHDTFSPMGYALEHYDAIGRYRTVDNGLPIDATGEIGFGDVTGAIDGGIELSQKLAKNTDVQECASGEWYQFAVGRELGATDSCRLAKVNQAIKGAGGDLRESLVMLAASPEFAYRTPPQ